MYPPGSFQLLGGVPAALLHDPETAEEVREALAIARAHARALHADVAWLTGDRARLAAALAEIVSTIERHLEAGRSGIEPSSLSLVAARLHQVRQSLLEPPAQGDAA